MSDSKNNNLVLQMNSLNELMVVDTFTLETRKFNTLEVNEKYRLVQALYVKHVKILNALIISCFIFMSAIFAIVYVGIQTGAISW